MLPNAVVKVVQIAAGYVVGVMANKAMNKAADGVKKVIDSKKKEAQ